MHHIHAGVGLGLIAATRRVGYVALAHPPTHPHAPTSRSHAWFIAALGCPVAGKRFGGSQGLTIPDQHLVLSGHSQQLTAPKSG